MTQQQIVNCKKEMRELAVECLNEGGSVAKGVDIMVGKLHTNGRRKLHQTYTNIILREGCESFVRFAVRRSRAYLWGTSFGPKEEEIREKGQKDAAERACIYATTMLNEFLHDGTRVKDAVYSKVQEFVAHLERQIQGSRLKLAYWTVVLQALPDDDSRTVGETFTEEQLVSIKESIQ